MTGSRSTKGPGHTTDAAADRETDQKDDRRVSCAIGNRWLAIPIRPNVAKTAVNPSSKGMPDAMSAPNASTRMINVTGTESTPGLVCADG